MILNSIDHFKKIFNNRRRQVFFNANLVKFSVVLICKYRTNLRGMYFYFNQIDIICWNKKILWCYKIIKKHMFKIK